MLKIHHLFMMSALAAGFMLAGCSDDYPSAKENPYANDLLSIKILNAGPEGNIEVEGTIDEDAKTIKFPKLDKESNFSGLQISATLSDGAHLDPETNVLDFTMDDATTQVTKTIRVKNHNRYKDYFMTVRKRVPVFGANFEKGTEICNFTGTSMYKYIASAQTRCTAFDGKYVLICYRNPTADDPTAPGAHVLKVSDLEQGIVKPISLSLDGVSGGTFPYNAGALAGGHIYLASLSGAPASPLKIYYYETPESTPECIADINVSEIAGAAARHGDVMSMNLDKDGNGFVFFPANDYSEALRIPISNFKNVGTPTSIELQADNKAGMCMHINRIEGTDDYILSGARVNLLGSTGKLSGMNLSLCDEGLNSKIRLNTNTVAAESDDARLFTFNGARYLLTAPIAFGSSSTATPGMYVYDLTKGTNTQESFQLFNDAESHEAAYRFLVGGSGISSPGINTNYFVEKDANGNDSVLWLYVGRTESGFAIMKFPAAKEDDE
jgi:hypothetical protein